MKKSDVVMCRCISLIDESKLDEFYLNIDKARKSLIEFGKSVYSMQINQLSEAGLISPCRYL